jgi:hypothetical protein
MTPEQQTRYDRWAKASDALAKDNDSPGWEALVTEEQAAWDDMADHDDPKYVEILDRLKS